jgi:hypothetical protein
MDTLLLDCQRIVIGNLPSYDRCTFSLCNTYYNQLCIEVTNTVEINKHSNMTPCYHTVILHKKMFLSPCFINTLLKSDDPYKCPQFMDLLIRHGANDWDQGLVTAAKLNDVQQCVKFIELGVSSNALRRAIRKASMSNSVDCAKLLIDNGAHPSAALAGAYYNNNNDWITYLTTTYKLCISPLCLHYAAKNSRQDVIESYIQEHSFDMSILYGLAAGNNVDLFKHYFVTVPITQKHIDQITHECVRADNLQVIEYLGDRISPNKLLDSAIIRCSIKYAKLALNLGATCTQQTWDWCGTFTMFKFLNENCADWVPLVRKFIKNTRNDIGLQRLQSIVEYGCRLNYCLDVVLKKHIYRPDIIGYVAKHGQNDIQHCIKIMEGIYSCHPTLAHKQAMAYLIDVVDQSQTSLFDTDQIQ